MHISASESSVRGSSRFLRPSLRQTFRYLSVILLLGASGQTANSDQKVKAPPDKRPPLQYSRSENGLEATVLLRDGRGIINLRIAAEGKASTAAVLMSSRLQLWKPLLERAFNEHGRRGSYLLTVGEYPELSRRAAISAACSKEWNLRSGKPNAGDAGAAFKDLLTKNALYHELESFFDSWGYRVTVRSAEAVMLCHWKELRSEPGDSPCNLEPDSMVPCGASLVFNLASR